MSSSAILKRSTSLIKPCTTRRISRRSRIWRQVLCRLTRSLLDLKRSLSKLQGRNIHLSCHSSKLKKRLMNSTTLRL